MINSAIPLFVPAAFVPEAAPVCLACAAPLTAHDHVDLCLACYGAVFAEPQDQIPWSAKFLSRAAADAPRRARTSAAA